MDNLPFIAIGLVVVLAVALMLLAKRQSRLQQALTQNQERIDRLMDELKALYAGAAGQGNHIARIEEQINQLSDRQEQIDVKDPTSQSYSEAIELIQSGASIDELVRHGLRREEAELLMRLHGRQSLG
jgi:septal ring factor EnvC (AmiA/AmiB activator)